MDRKFCHFGPFLPFYPPNGLENQKYNHDVWLLRYEMQQTEFFVNLDHFLPFYPYNNPENQNFEKMTPPLPSWRYYHFTQVYHKWQLYDVRFLRSGMQQNFLSFWAIFLPFYSPSNPENRDFAKIKNTPGDIVILHMCTFRDDHIINGFSNMECNRQNFWSFLAIFCSFTPITTQKIKILKKWKNNWRYHHFTQVYQKSWSFAVLFLRYGVWWM